MEMNKPVNNRAYEWNRASKFANTSRQVNSLAEYATAARIPNFKRFHASWFRGTIEDSRPLFEAGGMRNHWGNQQFDDAKHQQVGHVGH